MPQSEVYVWWFCLCAVSLANVWAWSYSATLVARRRHSEGGSGFVWCRWQVLLAAGYVFGCAYRSAFPVFDVPRQVLIDSWLSSVIIGRSVATIAELCFAAQWALLMANVSRTTGSNTARIVSRVLVPMIVLAELCSWYSVLTTSNIGHVVEESLWGLSAALIVGCLWVTWPRIERAFRPMLLVCSAAGVAYVAYMFAVDVPMYWSRFLADEAANRTYLELFEGVRHASTYRVVSPHWNDWKSEATWMSLYFSVGVWLSIALIHVPHRQEGQGQPQPTESIRPEARRLESELRSSSM